MDDWKRYKEKIRNSNSSIAKDLDEIEAISTIVGTMINQRHNLDLSQRELAEMCGLPHSSVARIESGKTTPNLLTLLKILKQLDLALKIEVNSNVVSK